MAHMIFPNGLPAHCRMFAKYHGNGNDFIIFDAPSKIGGSEEQWLVLNASKLCDRHRGIGADGILVLVDKVDVFLMTVINPDGSIAKNCGNGLRCAALHIFKSRNINRVSIKLFDRLYQCREVNGEISVSMGDCLVEEINDVLLGGSFGLAKVAQVDLGNRHRVFFIRQVVTDFSLLLSNTLIHCHKDDNIGFLFEREGQFFSVVYERGVGFTKSCGSGACAAASLLATLALDQVQDVVVIVQPGGALKIAIERKESTKTTMIFGVTQVGPAEEVFTGICQIEAN